MCLLREICLLAGLNWVALDPDRWLTSCPFGINASAMSWAPPPQTASYPPVKSTEQDRHHSVHYMLSNTHNQTNRNAPDMSAPLAKDQNSPLKKGSRCGHVSSTFSPATQRGGVAIQR